MPMLLQTKGRGKSGEGEVTSSTLFGGQLSDERYPIERMGTARARRLHVFDAQIWIDK